MSTEEDYPCVVDGAPASIGVNLRFEAAPPAGRDIRYTLAIALREPGPHGLGTATELAALERIEEALLTRAFGLGLVYAGHLRGRGVHEVTFYGVRGHLEALRGRALERAGERRIAAVMNPEPGWTYYRELLLPDPVRRRWLELSEQGALAEPRLVEHRLAFEGGRAGFQTAVHAAGFELTAAGVRRLDPVEPAHLHAVVAMLAAAAAPGGRYEDWMIDV